jgi:hypothetical protein
MPSLDADRFKILDQLSDHIEVMTAVTDEDSFHAHLSYRPSLKPPMDCPEKTFIALGRGRDMSRELSHRSFA